MLGMAELFSISRTLEMALRDNELNFLWLEEQERTVAEMSCDIAEIRISAENPAHMSNCEDKK